MLQLCLTRFRGGPIGGICWVARARNASAIKCGWVWIIDFQPGVSITSVACLLTGNKISLITCFSRYYTIIDILKLNDDRENVEGVKVRYSRINKIYSLSLKLIGTV